MKSFILILLGIIVALLIVGGAVAYSFMNELGVNMDNIDSNTIENVKNNSASQDSDIVTEVVKFNAQNGEGYYREVTYKDGGFRQYDTQSGELIGSSYSSDQANLPSME